MERTFKVILKPLQRFAIQKPNASVLLFLATILAMILANSPLQDRYHHFLQFPVKLVFGDFSIFSHHGEQTGSSGRRVTVFPESFVADCGGYWRNGCSGTVLFPGLS